MINSNSITNLKFNKENLNSVVQANGLVGSLSSAIPTNDVLATIKLKKICQSEEVQGYTQGTMLLELLDLFAYTPPVDQYARQATADEEDTFLSLVYQLTNESYDSAALAFEGLYVYITNEGYNVSLFQLYDIPFYLRLNRETVNTRPTVVFNLDHKGDTDLVGSCYIENEHLFLLRQLNQEQAFKVGSGRLRYGDYAHKISDLSSKWRNVHTLSPQVQTLSSLVSPLSLATTVTRAIPNNKLDDFANYVRENASKFPSDDPWQLPWPDNITWWDLTQDVRRQINYFHLVNHAMGPRSASPIAFSKPKNNVSVQKMVFNDEGADLGSYFVPCVFSSVSNREKPYLDDIQGLTWQFIAEESELSQYDEVSLLHYGFAPSLDRILHDAVYASSFEDGAIQAFIRCLCDNGYKKSNYFSAVTIPTRNMNNSYFKQLFDLVSANSGNSIIFRASSDFFPSEVVFEPYFTAKLSLITVESGVSKAIKVDVLGRAADPYDFQPADWSSLLRWEYYIDDESSDNIVPFQTRVNENVRAQIYSEYHIDLSFSIQMIDASNVVSAMSLAQGADPAIGRLRQNVDENHGLNFKCLYYDDYYADWLDRQNNYKYDSFYVSNNRPLSSLMWSDIGNIYKQKMKDSTSFRILRELLSAGSYQGKISISSLKNILNQDPTCDASIFISSAIDKLGSDVNYKTVATLVSSWIKSKETEINEEQDGFSPLATTRIETSPWSILGSIIRSTILPLIQTLLRAVAGVIGFVLSLVSSLLTYLFEQREIADGYKIVNPDAFVPVLGAPGDPFSQEFLTLCGIQDVLSDDTNPLTVTLRESGCAYVDGGEYGLGFVIGLMSGVSSAQSGSEIRITDVFIQPVIPMWMTGFTAPTRTYQTGFRDGNYYHYVFSITPTSLSYNPSIGGTWDYRNDTISKAIIQRRLAMCLSHYLSSDPIDTSATLTGTPGKWNTFSSFSSEYVAPISDLSDRTKIEELISSHNPDAKDWMYHSLVDRTDSAILFTPEGQDIPFCVGNGSASLGMAIEEWVNPFWKLMQTDIYMYFRDHVMYKYRTNPTEAELLYPCCDGASALVPAVSFPTISSAAFEALIGVTATVAASVVAISLVSKPLMKKYATSNLAKREKDFENARATYQDNPNPTTAKQLYKANKKLNRAWNFAGVAGVNSYNGFSTPTGAVTAQSSELLSFPTQEEAEEYAKAVSKMEDDMASNYYAVDLSEVIKLINRVPSN